MRRPPLATADRRPRILIPVTCAWTVRNILLSGVADWIRESADIVFALPENRDLSALFDGWETVPLPDADRTNRWHGHVRQRLGRAHFWIASENVAGTLARLYRYHAPVVPRLRTTLNIWRARFESAPKRYRRLVEREQERWQALNSGSVTRAMDLLTGVDLVLSPAPHSSRERWVARWAKQFGLRTTAIIHSFDNPTTTTRHFVTYDTYLVWNDRMRDELLRIYPEIPAGAIIPAGTPHFSFYFRPDLQGTREELARRFSLDPRRPIVLYGGGPKALVPHEPVLIERLRHDIQAIPEQRRPQLVVRPHPIERDFARWDVLRQYPEIRWSLPWAGKAADAEWAIPTTESLHELCLLVRHSDVLINCCSTMSIDAAVCDTPVVCLDYVLPPYQDFASIAHRYYTWDHYRPVIASGAVSLARSPEELMTMIELYLAHPEIHRRERAKLVRDMCGDAPERAVPRAAEIILETARSHVSRS